MTNLRYDHASFDGYSRVTTPNLDTLAGNSLIFDNAFSHASWTLPESVSIYTGLYPYQHGVMKRRDGSSLSKNTPTLVDYFNNNGYTTAAFTGGFDYNPAFGVTGRFQTYDECASGQEKSYPRQSGPRVKEDTSELYGSLRCTAPKAIEWLNKNSDKKFFLHVQGFDAHCPFVDEKHNLYDSGYKGNADFTKCLWTPAETPPRVIDGKTYYSVISANERILISEDDVRHLVALYDSSIAASDGYIGDLLDSVKKLGLEGKTIVIFTSEHGDMLGKNGRFMRGGPMRGTFYDDVLHVPLLVKLPGVGAKRLNGLVAHIDLMPTVLDLVGIRSNAKIEGKSLRPLIFGGAIVNKFIYAGSFFAPDESNTFFDRDSSVDVARSLEWKIIRETIWNKGESNNQTVNTELYNIASDNQEINNVAEKDKATLLMMERKLNEWVERFKPKNE